MRAPR
jgi:3-oxoacyl-[acyl-carrier protein] reductase